MSESQQGSEICDVISEKCYFSWATSNDWVSFAVHKQYWIIQNSDIKVGLPVPCRERLTSKLCIGYLGNGNDYTWNWLLQVSNKNPWLTNQPHPEPCTATDAVLNLSLKFSKEPKSRLIASSRSPGVENILHSFLWRFTTNLLNSQLLWGTTFRIRGRSRGRVQGVHTPPWDDLQFSNTTGILPPPPQKKTLCGLLVLK